MDNDGNALVTGALYYRTTAPIGMKVWDGAQWLEASAAQQASLVTYEYVATAGQTTFSGADANGVTLSYTVGNALVSVNGVRLRPGDDFSATNGTSVALVAAAAAGDEVLIDAFRTFEVANTYTQAQVNALLAAKADLASPSFTGSQTTTSAGTSTAHRGNIVSTMRANGAGFNATSRLSDSVANSADMSMVGGTVQFSNNGIASHTTNQFGIGLGSTVPSSGTGLSFPATQNASSDANTLDDYEEGSGAFSSVQKDGGGAGVGLAINSYFYIKVGRLVYLNFRVLVASPVYASTWRLNGLPFVNSANDAANGMILGPGSYAGKINAHDNYIDAWVTDPSGAQQNWPYLYGTLLYFTN